MEEQKTILKEASIIPVPKKDPEIGTDTSGSFNAEVLDAALTNSLDLNSINSLVQSAQNREQSYELIDAMSQDDVISAVLETYAEDTIQTNDKGQTVWVESDNGQVLDYVRWLLESINIDKHIYQWVYCLVTYGDVYIRLFRESDVSEDALFKKPEGKNKLLNEAVNHTFGKAEELREDVNLKVYTADDRYVPFVQMVDNPGEMFDLQKYGKTYGYIKAPIRVIQQQTSDEMYTYLTNYNIKKSDVELYDGTCFVHACLENTNQRQPETVKIFLDDIDSENKDSMYASYSVKRGQSILYNTFRIWRELNLLELSALMNRLTKSALVRILTIDIGDMPKEQVQPFLSRLKEKIEQKSAIDTGKSMQDYTAAGPIDNTIYIPKHGEQGNITATTIGGDFDPKSLVDIEYFRDKLFGCLRGTTNIKLSDGTLVNIKEAAENPERIIGKEINTCNIDGSIEKTKITNALQTKKEAEFIQFILEDDSVIEVTPEHLMMLTDGSYKEARDITEEDELMDIYYENEKKEKTNN